MQLGHIEPAKLVPSRLNMRHGRKPPDLANILPSVRKRGVIVPLIVRPVADGELDRFEIVAGLRRWHANGVALAEGIDHGPLPVAFLEAGDDADAIEASLIENSARLDPDEVTRWESFVRLVKEGRSLEDIAATFGIAELGVKRILALGNLLPRVRDLYRKSEIDAATVRHLTLASKSQQRAWLALRDDPDAYLPTGHQLKAWLFGGQSIPGRHALFDLDSYAGALIADLFGEDRYFADADQFWAAQEEVIAARRADYLAAGWSDVTVVPAGQHFETWAHEKAPKRKGGRVYIDVCASGEVVFHEGYLTRKEAQRLRGAETGEAASAGFRPARPEVTSTLQTYIDLHRHAAARAALTGHPDVALRLLVAHAITGSYLWNVKAEPQTCRNEAARESVETCKAEAEFDQVRRAVLDLLGFSPEEPTVVGGNGDPYGLVGLFLRLLDLPDRAVMDVIAVVMGETLASGSAAVEAVGSQIGLDMARYWQADDALFALIRDKEVLTRIVAEVAGESVAAANAGETGKTLKGIVRDHLGGANGRRRVESWVPRWMAFPPAAYTVRGGVGTVDAAALLAAARTAGDEPAPAGPGVALALPVPQPETAPQPLAA
ncbi:ParB/RepB/Spo0J family partition protein [Sphingosinicella sp. LHD-64]|uniref:ParB/RepB/Spo0J family partition protein n=1 Tax=Sphingosinicella sp. LHD-64 TaxID=3072139 RepID=UPI0028103A84|nr:ParB/RepB/Spo0J family partition protein [Sphingosinicella sp. LHD-64]MDQ8757465.1 ParB/RepB/Spo0J family partition protein [Sphingosinicella sp. LHD-64]